MECRPLILILKKRLKIRRKIKRKSVPAFTVFIRIINLGNWFISVHWIYAGPCNVHLSIYTYYCHCQFRLPTKGWKVEHSLVDLWHCCAMMPTSNQGRGWKPSTRKRFGVWMQKRVTSLMTSCVPKRLALKTLAYHMVCMPCTCFTHRHAVCSFRRIICWYDEKSSDTSVMKCVHNYFTW